MDSNLISDKRYLFAYCITDGTLDDMSEEERAAMIIDITEIKESMLKNTPQKYQNNKVVKIMGKYQFNLMLR